MMVGAWATSPAPTISPMSLSPSVLRRVLRLPGRGAHVLHVGVEVEAPLPPLAAYTGILGAAERRPQVADEEAVDPHGPGDQALGHTPGAFRVAGVHHRGEAVVGGVG